MQALRYKSNSQAYWSKKSPINLGKNHEETSSADPGRISRYATNRTELVSRKPLYKQIKW